MIWLVTHQGIMTIDELDEDVIVIVALLASWMSYCRMRGLLILLPVVESVVVKN